MQQILFFGSSEFSVSVLQKLLISKSFDVIGVVTTPDKPAGRHLRLTPNPLASFAKTHHLKIFYSATDAPIPKSTIGLVAAYGKIIRQEVLNMFNGQIFNIHPSLLPKYRGSSPLQNQILDGITETGVTIIQMDAEMDHGPIVVQKTDNIRPDDTWKSLGQRLFDMGTDLFLNLHFPLDLKLLAAQDHSQATYTQKLTRQNGFIDWEKVQDPKYKERIELLKRAYADWPGVWSTDPTGQRIKLI